MDTTIVPIKERIRTVTAQTHCFTMVNPNEDTELSVDPHTIAFSLLVF